MAINGLTQLSTEWKFKIVMVSSERAVSDLSKSTLSSIKKIFFHLSNSIFYVQLLPKFSDFVNSDDSIGKIISKSIRIYPVFIFFLNVKLMENRFFLVKK